MEQYEMGSWLAGIHTRPKVSPMQNFKHWIKYDMVVNMATLFVKEILQRSRLLDNLKPLDKNLTSEELQLETLPSPAKSWLPYQPLHNLFLGWYSWPSNALRHCSLNRPLGPSLLPIGVQKRGDSINGYAYTSLYTKKPPTNGPKNQ